jgi:hypothetical protein
MTDSPTDGDFREEARLRADELGSPATPAIGSPATPASSGRRQRTPPGADGLSPAQRKKREVIARKKAKAKAKKAEKKAAAEKERAEAEAAAKRAEEEEAEADAAEAAAAREAADVEAAERALEDARATGDPAAIAAAEERLETERAEAAAFREKARQERLEAKAAREEAAREEAEAAAAEAALQAEVGDEQGIQATEEKVLRHHQAVRAEEAHERERKLALHRKDEDAAVKDDLAKAKTARKKADALASVTAKLKPLRAKVASVEKGITTAAKKGEQATVDKLNERKAALEEQIALLALDEEAATQEANDAAETSKKATAEAVEFTKVREAAQKEHVALTAQGENAAEDELKRMLLDRRDREEARLDVAANAEEEELEREAAATTEGLQAERAALKEERDEEIQRLRRAENDASNAATNAAAEAQQKKDAHLTSVATAKQLQTNVNDAKTALAAANKIKPRDTNAIANAEERLVQAEAEARPASKETVEKKAEWDAAELRSKKAAKEAAGARTALEAAEREDVKLLKQTDKEISASEKKRLGDKAVREKRRAKEKAARDQARAKDYNTQKEKRESDAAAAAAEAALNRETRDVERAYLALQHAKEDGDPATIRAAEEALAKEKAEAAAAREKAAQERAAAAVAAKAVAAAEKERLKQEKAAAKLKRQEARQQAKLKRTASVEKERDEAQEAQKRADKEQEDVDRAEKELMAARKSKIQSEIDKAEENLTKETREAAAAAREAKRERDEAIQALVDAENDAKKTLEDAQTKATEQKDACKQAEAKLKADQEEVARAERKLEETMASGDANATQEEEKIVLAFKAEAEEAAAVAAKEARDAKELAAESALAAEDAAEQAALCKEERVLAEKQRAKLEQLEQKLKESRTKKEAQAQKAALLKLGGWLRGWGYSDHLHAVADKLQRDGHSRGDPPGTGWIAELEKKVQKEPRGRHFEVYMVDVHHEENWQEIHESRKKAAFSKLRPPERKAKTMGKKVACCAAPTEEEEARRRAEEEMKEAAEAHKEHQKELMDVQRAEAALEKAKASGNEKKIKAAEEKLQKERDEHAAAHTKLQKEQEEAEEAQAEAEALQPTKSHPIEPLRVSAHGQELAALEKPPTPRLVRADSAEEMYGSPRTFHKEKSPWQNPSVRGRQRKEREEITALLSKSMEDESAEDETSGSTATKDESLDRSYDYEKDEKDYLDLTGVSEQKKRGVTVSVMACRNLPKADLFGKTDPYIKVWVAGGPAQTTSVIDNGGADPSWGENGHKMEFFATVEGFPWIKVKAYDEDIGPAAIADDLLGKCDIDMGRLKLQLWENSEVRGWFPLLLKGKRCGAVELKIEWDPYPSSDDDLLGVRARTRLARRRKRQTRPYGPDNSNSAGYLSRLVAVIADEAELRQELCGKWRARGTLEENMPSPSTRANASFNSQAWLETVGREEEEFELSIGADGELVGKPLDRHGHGHADANEVLPEVREALYRDHFEMTCALYRQRDASEVDGQLAADQWHITMTQHYTVTGNVTEWSAVISSDGSKMEHGRWSGEGINGQFCATRLCRAEPEPHDTSHGTGSSRHGGLSAREELAAAEARVAQLVATHGEDHDLTMEAHLEQAEIMRRMGNDEGHESVIDQVEMTMDFITKRERFGVPASLVHDANESRASVRRQFSPAPSAVLPNAESRRVSGDGGGGRSQLYSPRDSLGGRALVELEPESQPPQPGRRQQADRPGMGEFANVPGGIHLSPPTDAQRAAREESHRAGASSAELTLSPAVREPAAVEPDHIAAMLDDGGGSPLGTVSPAARLDNAPPLEELLGADDGSPREYRAGEM